MGTRLRWTRSAPPPLSLSRLTRRRITGRRRALSLDAHGPSFRMDRRPDSQVEIELELARLWVERKRLTKAGLEPPLTDKLHIEAKIAEEVGQIMRLREVADLDLDTAEIPLQGSQTRHLPLLEVWAGCGARQGGSVLALRGAVTS